MGYFIKTILSKELSTEEKISRMEFALTFDWMQKPTMAIWDKLTEIELAPYVGEYRWTSAYSFGPDLDVVGPNEYGRSGWPPLAAAVEIQDIVIADWLLKHEAEVDQVNSNGMTPIFLAARYGYINMFQFLYDSGANLLHKKDRVQSGISLLEEAIRYGQLEIVTFMLSRPEINTIENLKDIESAIPFAMVTRARVHDEEKNDLTEIIMALKDCCRPLHEQQLRLSRQKNEAATKIQATFRRHHIQTAYQAYINRPSIDALMEENKFAQAKKALSDIKDQKHTLGLANRVRFSL